MSIHLLGDLRPGAIFENKDGVRAFKTGYHDGATQCICYSLQNGERIYFPMDDKEEVREIVAIPPFRGQPAIIVPPKGYQGEAKNEARDAIMLDVVSKMKTRHDHIEMLAAAFLKRTAIDPTKCELVEQQHADGKTTAWYFRERVPAEPVFIKGNAQQIEAVRKAVVEGNERANLVVPYYGDRRSVLSSNGEQILEYTYDDSEGLHLLDINAVYRGYVVARNHKPSPNIKGELRLVPMDRGPSPLRAGWGAFKVGADMKAAIAADHGDVKDDLRKARQLICEQTQVAATCAGLDTEIVDGKVVMKRDVAKGETFRTTPEHYERITRAALANGSCPVIHRDADDALCVVAPSPAPPIKESLLKAAKLINEGTNSLLSDQARDIVMDYFVADACGLQERRLFVAKEVFPADVPHKVGYRFQREGKWWEVYGFGGGAEGVVDARRLVATARCPVCEMPEGDCEDAGYCAKVIDRKYQESLRRAGMVLAGYEVAPGVVPMSAEEQEQAKALLGFEIPGLTSVERTADGGIAFVREGQPVRKYVQIVQPKAECTCASLLNGHERGCHLAEK